MAENLIFEDMLSRVRYPDAPEGLHFGTDSYDWVKRDLEESINISKEPLKTKLENTLAELEHRWSMRHDCVIGEINKFFVKQGFEKIILKSGVAYRYKNKYYRFSLGTGRDSISYLESDEHYYLREADNFTDAESNNYKNITDHEHVRHDVGSYISEIECDIKTKIINKA